MEWSGGREGGREGGRVRKSIISNYTLLLSNVGLQTE